MPPGTYHAVATVEMEGIPFSPTVLHSTFYNSLFGLEKTLASAIQNSVWYREWTNIVHNQRFLCIAYMLEWFKPVHGSMDSRDLPSLFALVLMGLCAPGLLATYEDIDPQLWTEWNPFEDLGDNSLMPYLQLKAQERIQEFPPAVRMQFDQFVDRFLDYWGSERRRRWLSLLS